MPPPGFVGKSSSGTVLPALNDWYKGSFRDALNLAREDVLASYPYTSTVPPPLPIVGSQAAALGSTVAVEPPPGRLVGIASGFSNFEGLDGMINDGLLDSSWVIQEAARRKQDIDRALSIQIAELESEAQHRQAAIMQQAEHHTRLAEQQVESQKRSYIAHVTAQTETKAAEVSRRAREEKDRLGQEARGLIAERVERTKAAAMHQQMLATEAMQRENQQYLADQTQALRQQIKTQTMRRGHEIDVTREQALTSIFNSQAVP